MLAYAVLRWIGNTPDEAKDLLRQMRPTTAEGMHERHFAWGDAVMSERDAQPRGMQS
jgi:hypothetical protein